MGNIIEFTQEELIILSNGILALINNAGIAKNQVSKSYY